MPVTMQVDLSGQESAFAAFTNIPGAIDTIVEDVTIRLRELIEGRTPVGDPKTDKHSGALKKSWSMVQRAGQYSYSFGTAIPYAPTVEEGRYKGVGPRTVAEAGGIFSRQAPGGMVGPLVADTVLVQRIVEEIVNRIFAQINNA